MLETMPDSPANASLLAMAIGMLADTDPAAAIARFEELPPGSERDRLASRIATGLARTRPEAALSFLDGLESPSPDIFLSLVQNVAPDDFGLALEVIDRIPRDTMSSVMLVFGVQNAFIRDPDKALEIPDMLVARTDNQSRQALQRALTSWTARDPDAALDWVSANANGLEYWMLNGYARNLADDDHIAAAELATRIPGPLQRGWIVQIAPRNVRADPDAVMGWIGQYRGTDFYDEAVTGIVTGLAELDRERAERMLENEVTDPDLRQRIREQLMQSDQPPVSVTLVPVLQ
jgi:hypothetical protein